MEVCSNSNMNCNSNNGVRKHKQKKRGKGVASIPGPTRSNDELAQIIQSKLEKHKQKQKKKNHSNNAVLNQDQAKSLQKLLQDTNISDTDKTNKLREMYVVEARKANSLELDCKALEAKITKQEAEINKMQQRKDRLELLCRELQRQNKTVMEETKKITFEESNKRITLQNKFETSLEEVAQKLREQGEDRIKQMEENNSLRERLAEYVSKFDEYQGAIKKQMETKDLEIQLKEAKAEQRLEMMKQELEKFSKSISTSVELEKENTILRRNLEEYGEKFNEFHSTVTKTNELNQACKNELSNLMKKNNTLEKETKSLREKLVHVTLTGIEKDKAINTAETQVDNLKSLCRTLQNERDEKEKTIQKLLSNSSENIN
mmetsp:Transcript_1243/g.1885  ORF Transcript_1243/g.1885 Transcript_1243/m.1885 type:complete len:375 (+) Transcript_1243:100-1224(+)|eukprot:CAMPEP_0204825934 /NCGR_PEP_ID=MMETSP1346-20131115/3719_1 /ASSEMBLY_ACC=CAM_ASM_000771 /TAXON_ID=215587 /ORGANISM="Aplanochytrium stocchinoi, Strain GSBS06" /LENGTH=374 /DNA_ID=CAMNT_0051953735 /DNA_START=72 /DNA_END=1196 /DNA_ORIENTATION=+